MESKSECDLVQQASGQELVKDTAERNAQDMSQGFESRGYKQDIISTADNEAKSLPREQLLVQKQKEEPNSYQLYFVTQYSSEANRIIKGNWDILKSDSSLQF